MPSPAEIISAAAAWAALDPNPLTSSAVLSLVSAAPTDPAALASLTSAFSSRIAFGTAGLRSAMSFGPAHMNDLVIIQTCQGLASYILSSRSPGSPPPTAVVGYDHRELPALGLSSLLFAQRTKAVLEARGIPTLLLSGFVPTPLVPFAVSERGAAVGVMVTASHNPKGDDGYKVYWGDGSQIVPPHDGGIKNAILESLTPGGEYGVAGMGGGDGGETKRLLDLYFARIGRKLATGSYVARGEGPSGGVCGRRRGRESRGLSGGRRPPSPPPRGPAREARVLGRRVRSTARALGPHMR